MLARTRGRGSGGCARRRFALVGRLPRGAFSRRRGATGQAKVDARAVDPNGEAALVSLVLPPDGITIAFDDPAVSGALRASLAEPWPDVLSTLVVESSRFAGALTAVRDGDRSRLGSDPFARIFPAELVEVGPGLLGRTPSPVGPGIQRYGGGNPWPWDSF